MPEPLPPLTDAELIALRELHAPAKYRGGLVCPTCELDADDWPCQPARLVEELQALRRRLAMMKGEPDAR